MSIVNYGELKAAVIDYAKRNDLAPRIDDFIRAAHIKIVEYVGPLDELQDDEDTNNVLNYSPFPYLYGALAQIGQYTRDTEMMSIYDVKFQQELNNLALTGYDVIKGSPSVYPY